MKAVTIHRHGGLEELRFEDVARPKPGEDEVLLDVRAAGLNHLDIWVRKGRPGMKLRMPHVLGSDASGVVVEVGSRVRRAKAGDDIIIKPRR